ncbi:Hypothetical predicted protein [Mytilus galloprovincialis]|uniref:MULE transposase domain-containing protein n=1 Tax=Mytilus galloprovincialis TaxID=29158 RepID=A0A8B6G2I4_MYTGA|nr:Hypothetical predicted protein [Mytilus galloprovincialis]
MDNICICISELLLAIYATISSSITRPDGAVGVDRTFNLGNVFVTALVYKHYRLVKEDTKDHPIFIGPILLHKDASYKTYFTFFYHLASEFKINSLMLRIPDELVFGSDDEKAITNAIRNAFPSATKLLCTKHLKDTLKHYLQNKIKKGTKSWTAFLGRTT